MRRYLSSLDFKGIFLGFSKNILQLGMMLKINVQSSKIANLAQIGHTTTESATFCSVYAKIGDS